MSIVVTGVVANGVVVPTSPLPEGAQIEVCVKGEPPVVQPADGCLSASALLKLPREQRDAYLAARAAEAEELYRTDKNLMGFDAFSEELDDDDTGNGIF
jgi:hypothetical protein